MARTLEMGHWWKRRPQIEGCHFQWACAMPLFRSQVRWLYGCFSGTGKPELWVGFRSVHYGLYFSYAGCCLTPVPLWYSVAAEYCLESSAKCSSLWGSVVREFTARLFHWLGRAEFWVPVFDLFVPVFLAFYSLLLASCCWVTARTAAALNHTPVCLQNTWRL